MSSAVHTVEEIPLRAQDVLRDGVSPEMVLKGGQKLKWGEKGHSRRGASTNKGPAKGPGAAGATRSWVLESGR